MAAVRQEREGDRLAVAGDRAHALEKAARGTRRAEECCAISLIDPRVDAARTRDTGEVRVPALGPVREVASFETAVEYDGARRSGKSERCGDQGRRQECLPHP